MNSIVEHIPNGEISRYVESFWNIDSIDKFEIIPDGTFSFIFSHGPINLIDIKRLILPAGIYLIPILRKKIQLQTNSNTSVLRCKPFVQSGINRLDFDTIDNSIWTCNKSNTTNYFLKSLQEILEPDLSSSKFGEFIFEIFEEGYKIDENLRAYVNYILQFKGDVSINKMESEFNISRQAIHKIFNKELGISPKMLAQIWKMNSFINYIHKGDNLLGASIESGYYDQAHCINNFKKLNTMPPKSFFKKDNLFLMQSIHNRFNNSYDPKI